MEIKNTSRTQIVGALLFIVITFFAASWYIQNTQAKYILETKLKIAEQETTLAALAELTDRDGADVVVERIIQDCSLESRKQFDDLLSRLSQLSHAELLEIDQLFNECGNFYAERKAVMSSRMQREYEVYLSYINILSLIDDRYYATSNKPEQWGELVALEEERSQFSTDLVLSQDQIISALIDGVKSSSEEMKQMLKTAQEKKETLIYLNSRIDQLRQEVIDL